MSKATATNARKFVTAYLAGGKSSVAMVKACVAILNDGTPSTALVAAVRGAYESAGHAFDSAIDRKKFETLVSQRAFAASVLRTVGDDTADDDTAIRAAVSVASGQLPRTLVKGIAADLADTNDGPSFVARIKAAKEEKAATPRAPRASNDKAVKDGDTAETNVAVAAPSHVSPRVALEALEAALSTADDKSRAAILKAVKALVLRHTLPVQAASPVDRPAPVESTPVKAPVKRARKAAVKA